MGCLTGFSVALRFGAGILLVSFLAQFGGYSTLSSRMVDSSLKTVFLGFFAAMTVKLGQGGIEFLFGQDYFRRWRFFSRYGGELTSRLKTVFIALVAGYASLHLLEIWNVYGSSSAGLFSYSNDRSRWGISSSLMTPGARC